MSERTAEAPDLSKASHDFVPPQALVDFMSAGWIDRPSCARAPPADQPIRRAPQSAFVGISRERISSFRPDANACARTTRPSGFVPRATSHIWPAATASPAPFSCWNRRAQAIARSSSCWSTIAAKPSSSPIASTANSGSDAIAASRRAKRITAPTNAGRRVRCRSTSTSSQQAEYPLRLVRGHDEDDRSPIRSDRCGCRARRNISPRCGSSKTNTSSASCARPARSPKLAFEDAIRAMRGVHEPNARSKARFGIARASKPTTSATSRSPPPRNTPARCIGRATMGRCVRAVFCCSMPASSAIRSTLPTSRARCRFPEHFRPSSERSTKSFGELSKPASRARSPGNDFLEPGRRATRVMAEALIDLGILKTSRRRGARPRKALSPPLYAPWRQSHARPRRARLRRRSRERVSLRQAARQEWC